jgi:hypothetical protein
VYKVREYERLRERGNELRSSSVCNVGLPMKRLLFVLLLSGCTVRVVPDLETAARFNQVEKWSAGVAAEISKLQASVKALEEKKK